MRRIVYSIGEGLLVIALFTAALSAQNATTVLPAKVAVVAPPHIQTEGLNPSEMAEPQEAQPGRTGIEKFPDVLLFPQ